MPASAWDCHAHVFGAYADYPLDPSRQYTPPVQDVSDYLRMLDATGLALGVLSQPSVYGMDNTSLVDALLRAKGRLRGIVVADLGKTGDEEMKRLDDAGVRGIRLNMALPGGLPPSVLKDIGRRLAEWKWHLEVVFKSADDLPALAGALAVLPVPVVIEQMGSVRARDSVQGKGFSTLLDLVRKDGAWCKLSHSYKISADLSTYADTLVFARAIIAASSSTLVWGSDWPHPRVPGPMPTDGFLLDLLHAWTDGDAAILQAILAANPGRLYGARPGPEARTT